MTEDRPVGRRYSHVYAERNEPVYESKRLQARVAAYISTELRTPADAAVDLINRETGFNISTSNPPSTLPKHMRECNTADFLESLTVITWSLIKYDHDNSRYSSRKSLDWTAFVDRAMNEENSKFEIDSGGGVHPRIDAAFTADRVAALKGLSANRYFTAREHFEAAHAALDERPPANNRSIREIFLANEEVFKLVFPVATKLEGGEIQRRVGPILEALVSGAERDAINGMIRGAVDYIAASHSFRHAKGNQNSRRRHWRPRPS